MEAPARQVPRVAILVGLPLSLRAQLEQQFKGRLLLRIVPMKRDGGYFLEPPPRQAARLMEEFADQSIHDDSYEELIVLLLTYARIPEEVEESARALGELGARVVRSTPATAPWPPRHPNLEKKFQDALLVAVAATLEELLPKPAQEWEDIVIETMLRALATHSKMSETNHSHEDDLWKSCGDGVGSGERRRIAKRLLDEGILGRKKNKSMGGTGWVYWIENIALVRTRFPALEQYLK